ncbi:atpob [Salix suchowensis]|nr:atpob [Salix suchowensis]
MSLNIIWLALSLCLSPFVRCSDSFTTDTLDTFLQDSAFKSLAHQWPHTGALYKGLIPVNLSGMEVSIVRIRSRTLWNIGANFSNFQIPSRTMTSPHVKRLAIVYQDLGNWSSYYYSAPGYSMITPVVGFMVFNASNARAEKCHSQDQGHFSIVVPLQRRGRDKRKHCLWYLWVIELVLGFSVVALLGYFGIVSLKLLKTKTIQAMERQADEDLVLDTVWVGSGKMPSATVTRTQPNLENAGF